MINPVKIKIYKHVFTPSVSIIKLLTEGASVYASVNAGYSPATLAQMTRTNGTVNTDLKPEMGLQYEAGVKGTSGKLKNITYQLAVFDLEVTDRLIQETSNSVTSYTNAGRQRNTGAEVYFSYNILHDKTRFLTSVKPWISYTWSHFKYVDFINHGVSSGGGDTILASYSGNRVAGVPENVVNLGLDIQSSQGFYV